MKRTLISIITILLCANLASAQTGTLCLFSDPQGIDCTINDPAPGLIQIYVVHMGAENVQAVQFSAPVPACMNAIFLGDISPWPLVIGTSQNGVLVEYTSCLSSPVHVLTMNIFGHGLSQADCPFAVLPDPAVGVVEVTDCNDVKLPAAGGITFVNSSLPCACGTLADPVLYVNPLALDFGTTDLERQFLIANTGGGSLVWDVSETIPWLEVTPTTGAGGATIDVTVDRSGLIPGYYSGLIHITSNGGNETVTAEMSVPAPNPVLGVTPAVLKFAAVDSVRWLTIFNAGTGDLDWSVASDRAWLSVDPAAGTNHTDVAVYVDRTGLSDGTHYGNLLVTSNGGDGTVPVEVTVATEPVLSVMPTLLTFSPVVTTRGFSISNTGFGTLSWALSTDRSWIEIVPPLSGTEDALVTINVDPADVPSGGAQTGHVTVISNGGTQTVEIQFMPMGPVQGGLVGVFADASGVNCNIVDVTPGLLEVYVVHMNTSGAMASQFAAPKPSCMTGVSWLSDVMVFPVTIGNSQTGASVAYGVCLASPIHVLTIQFFSSGLSETCCMYQVVAAPGATSGEIEVVDCTTNLLFGSGLVSGVNPDASCVCGAVRVEKSTWGKVKALYAPEYLKAIRR